MLTPHGTIRVFELGPPTASERVLLLPGLSTPCIALSNLATALVDKGNCRVLLFDYFGRGWSDTPDPEHVDHDEKLYITQILYVLASSTGSGSWLDGDDDDGRQGKSKGFHVMGYSFGGGLAVSFASYFPHLVRSVTLIAPGGLMPWSGNSWRTRMLYFTRGIFPECILQHFVRRRFEPSATALSPVPSNSGDNGIAVPVSVEQAENGSDPFDSAAVATRKRRDDDDDNEPGQVNVTVADVIAWQLRHHRGFVPAIMSAFRYGPIHERYEEWGRLGQFLAAKRGQPRQCGEDLPGGLLLGGKVLLVLGKTDPIVREERLVPEMKRVLGEGAVEVVVLDAGHEVAITKGAEIVGAALRFWGDTL